MTVATNFGQTFDSELKVGAAPNPATFSLMPCRSVQLGAAGSTLLRHQKHSCGCVAAAVPRSASAS